jgi:hypothetical protein
MQSGWRQREGKEGEWALLPTIPAERPMDVIHARAGAFVAKLHTHAMLFHWMLWSDTPLSLRSEAYKHLRRAITRARKDATQMPAPPHSAAQRSSAALAWVDGRECMERRDRGPPPRRREAAEGERKKAGSVQSPS